ncbi:MAG: YesL family protein [Clostridia bacterium]|nr:YesL family protein [Clostridia bacterium]
MKEFNEFGEPIEEPKKKKWGFFSSYTKDGKGVEKSDVITDYNFINFFKLYARRFVKLIWVNALYIVGNFPIIFLLLALSGYFSKMGSSPASELFSVVNGIGTASGGTSVSLGALMGIHGGMDTIFANTWATYILYGLAALFFVTFGPVNAGCTYIVRNLVKGEHIFMWQDFITTIKQNWKQAIPMGILDLITILVCSYSLMSYYYNYTNYYVLFWSLLVVIMLYSFMRFYLYTIMVTFELGFFGIIKNAAIFCLLGFGRNIILFGGIVMLVCLTFVLGQVFLPLGVISLLLLLFSGSAFMGMYAAYPKIKKYMIDPYYTKAEAEE